MSENRLQVTDATSSQDQLMVELTRRPLLVSEAGYFSTWLAAWSRLHNFLSEVGMISGRRERSSVTIASTAWREASESGRRWRRRVAFIGVTKPSFARLFHVLSLEGVKLQAFGCWLTQRRQMCKPNLGCDYFDLCVSRAMISLSLVARLKQKPGISLNSRRKEQEVCPYCCGRRSQ